MTTTVLAPDARRNVALFSVGGDQTTVKPKFRFEKRVLEGKAEETDVLIVEDLPVFRSGTFRDSIGYQHTWESIHMDQMVSHFDLLRSRGILVDVPTRAGHPGFLTNALKEVIGYHTGLRAETRTNSVDGEDYVYLLATFEILDPVAAQKVSSGLWRNVSAEVGGYITNNEAEFWPVYQGVAYVDIPAVEGLKSFSNHNGVGTTFSLMQADADKEAPVSGTTTTTLNTTPPGGTPPTTPAAQSPADVAYHGRANFTFSIGGQQTSDFAAVQAHITGLEGQVATFAAAQAEAKDTNRKMFIKGLAEGATPKILASQIAGIEAYALGLPDDAWAAFEKAHTEMAPMAAVSQHAQGTGTNAGGTTPVGGAAPVNDELAVAAEIVMNHRRSNMPTDKLKATGSFGKLKAADVSKLDATTAAAVSKALAGIPA